MSSIKCYIGIDPGASGGIACISPGGVSAVRLGRTDQSILADLQTLKQWCEINETEPIACIEQQTPRPTWIPTLERSTVLASTCELYGNYCKLCAMLLAIDIPFKEVLPKMWQGWLGLKKSKNMNNTAWKSFLKDTAQEIFPDVKVTLATADALLLAKYIEQMDRMESGANAKTAE